MKNHSMRSRLIAALAVMLPLPASAIGEVSGPNVTKDRLDFEFGTVRQFNDRPKRDVGSHEAEIKYGLTDSLRPEMAIEFVDEAGSAIKVDALEFGGQYQFAKTRDHYWMDAALRASYVLAPHSEDSDAIKLQLLTEKKHARMTYRAMAIAKQSLGHDSSSGGPEYSIRLNSRYNVSPTFALGLEYDGEFGQAAGDSRFEDQAHYVGPAMYGTIIGDLKGEIGYLVGLSDAASDGAARMIVEYGIPF